MDVSYNRLEAIARGTHDKSADSNHFSNALPEENVRSQIIAFYSI